MKFLERLKDDFIVRGPKKEVEQLADIQPTSPVPTLPKPTPKDRPQLQLVAQRDEPKPAPKEEQAVLPFNPEL